MKQISQVKFESSDKKSVLHCDTDVALGELHDFLMALKGEIVDRMVKAHKGDVDTMQKAKEAEAPPKEAAPPEAAV